MRARSASAGTGGGQDAGVENQPTDAGPGEGGVALALRALRDEVARVRLGLATAEAADAQRSARAVVEQVDD